MGFNSAFKWLIDVAIPEDRNVITKEVAKILKYKIEIYTHVKYGSKSDTGNYRIG
jgi:hypothetical protein